MPETYTNPEKVKALRRECKYRKSVYQRLVEQEKMSPADATYQLEIMRAILHDYEEAIEPSLFG